MIVGPRTPITYEQALATWCAMCGATPGYPCTYVATANLRHRGSVSPLVIAGRNLIDTPTRQLHNARRRNAYWRMRDWLAANGDIFTQETP